MAPSDHLLRTLAAVAPGARVVDLACGAGRHLDPLARLGFDVWGTAPDDASGEAARQSLAATLGADEARRRVTRGTPDALGYPDDWADWAVCSGVDPARLPDTFAEARRVVKPGAWIWVEAVHSDGLAETAEAAGLVVAEAPREEGGVTHAVFRRPGAVG